MSAGDLRLDPEAAARIVNACYVIGGVVGGLRSVASHLTDVAASGTYRSGTTTDSKLSALGEVAVKALNMLVGEIEKAGAAARAGGQALINQDDENQSSIRRALDSPDGIDPVQKALPGGPIGYPGAHSSDPLAGAAAMAAPFGSPEAGPFPMNLIPEALPNFSIDPALAALGPAQPAALTTLSSQWAQLANQLRDAFAAFNSQISVLGTDVFSGVAASQMKQSLDRFSNGGKRVADEAQANSAAISAWAGFVAQSQAQAQTLEQGRTTALAAAGPENALQVHQIYDSLSQMQLSATWNPPLTTMNGSIVNLSDPSSPVAGVPLYPPGMGPKPGAGGSNSLAVGTYPSRSAGGANSGGGGGGGGPSASAAKADAADLQRAGNGTAPSAGNAAGTTPPAGAPSSGNGDPVSAMSQAGKSADGLTRGGLGSAATKSAGADAMKSATAAEKSAAAKAAMGAGKAGSGGAGAGGLGKIGASESSLSSRSLGSISAAERAMAAEPAGPASARTAPGTAGSPMGGRGASAGGGESGGKHKSARYLQSTENGEEIVGDLDDVAPGVLGGLNLDTSDNPPTPPRAP